MSWEDDLLTATLDGIEFPVLQRTVFGGQDFARAKYQNVPGQDVEPTGLDARRFEIATELFASVDPDHYPNRYRKLHDLLQNKDKRGEVEYVDPVWGPINVIIDHWEIHETAHDANGARFTFYLEERSSEPVQVMDLRFSDPRNLARALAQDADLAMPQIGLPALTQGFEDIGWPLTKDESLSFPGILLKLTDDMFDAFDESALALEDIAFEVDRYRYRVDKILSFDPMKSAQNWDAFAAAVQLSATVTKVATAIGLGGSGTDSQPQTFVYELPAEMSAVEVSRAIYGDASHADRIVQLNPTPNPLFYQAGAKVTLDTVTF